MANNRFQLEYYQHLFDAEDKFMAKPGYSKHCYTKILRKKAISLLENYSRSDDFDAFIPYLAITYFDRLISRRKPDANHEAFKIEDGNWKLFLICCLAIAWKTRTREFDLPLFLDMIQKNYTDVEVLKMETCILNELDWQMRPTTPICFADYYMENFLPHAKYHVEAHRLVKEFIIAAQADIRITKYRPSVIAACAVIEVTKKLFSQFVVPFVDALSGSCESAQRIRQQVIENRVELADIIEKVMRTLAVPSTDARSITSLQTLLGMPPAAGEIEMSKPSEKTARTSAEERRDDKRPIGEQPQEDDIQPAESSEKAAAEHLWRAAEETRAGKRPMGEPPQEDIIQPAELQEKEAAERLRAEAEERRAGKRPMGEKPMNHEIEPAQDKTDDNGQLDFDLKWVEYQEVLGVSRQDYCVTGLCTWWYKIAALCSKRI